MPTGTEHTRPLEGLRVLDVSTLLAAPTAATMLAEYGADVIKIEQPRMGDPVRHFQPRTTDAGEMLAKLLNRNKRCVTLDLRTDEGRDILLQLAAKSDVIVMNFRPPTLKRMRIDWDDLRAVNPRLIMFHLSAFGRTGPYADRPGFARVAEAFAGLTYMTGEPDGPPVLSGFPVVDPFAGVYGAFAIMIALEHRRATGEGQLIDLALYEPLLRTMEDFIVTYAVTGKVRERTGNAQPHVAPNNLYPTRDEKWIVLPVSTPNMWDRLRGLLDEPALAQFGTIAERLANREEIDAVITAFTTSMDRDELLALLEEHQIAAGRVNDVTDIVTDPHIRARGNLTHLVDPATGVPLTFQSAIPTYSSITPSLDHLGPDLGAHNVEIYGELLEMDDARLADLEQRGVI